MFPRCIVIYGLFTLDDTENDTETDNDNDNYRFHCNMQSISHCTETPPLMPLAAFSHFIGLATSIILSVAQCERTGTFLFTVYYGFFCSGTIRMFQSLSFFLDVVFFAIPYTLIHAHVRWLQRRNSFPFERENFIPSWRWRYHFDLIVGAERLVSLILQFPDH